MSFVFSIAIGSIQFGPLERFESFRENKSEWDKMRQIEISLWSVFHLHMSISIHAWEIRMIKADSGLKGSTQGTQDHLGPYDSISIMTDHTCWRVWWKSMPSLWWGKDVAFSAIPQFWLSQSSTNIFVVVVAWLFGVSALLLDLAASHPRICQKS